MSTPSPMTRCMSASSLTVHAASRMRGRARRRDDLGVQHAVIDPEVGGPDSR